MPSALRAVRRTFGSDAREEDEVVALIEKIESEVGPIEVMAFNIGANIPASILEETDGYG